ncbi:hypothetical protein CWE09_12365 [Aliidiomarina minuta]|uniref:Phosphofructokinase n=1 Tax=Aliidiomarina minuta TaxID=880057 RepID=A0A432W3Q8_9GAMM|nr:1-phosphofructokinase family hexose kinase [Aliidiomarina minuta]RUO23936.1 hypothetical protein CWE09_12365 [Aliidiomarina minuta]
MPAIVTFTMNPAVDLFGVTEEIFDDSKSRCRQTALEPGGGGINVARNVRRMGSESLAIFPAGGLNGELLKSLLEKDNTQFKAIPISADTRMNFAITERKRSIMQHFVFPGPDLSTTEWDACQQAVLDQPCGYLVLSGSLPDNAPHNFYVDITQQANQKGCKVMLDTSGVALQESLYQGAYLAKLNRKEFASLGYDENDDIPTLTQQMRTLVDKGAADVLIVTLSRGGAVLVAQDGSEYQFSAPKVHIVSHVGAGDSFMSALAHQLNQGADLKTAFKYGVAAACVTVQTEGNQLTDLGWLQRMLDEIGEA